jgi:c-di-GMP-binding flagellar brake protein YcgR
MNELLSVNQEFSVVPKDFKNSNKGRISMILDKSFSIEVINAPEGLEAKSVMEFYSQTKHGTLYFTSPVVKVEGNTVVVLKPRKHRFLQRRAFSRVKFIQELELACGNKTYKSETVDLSAGGLKLRTHESVDLDSSFDIALKLPGGEIINTQYLPIKIEKSEEGIYTLAGRFNKLSEKDRMKIIQFCMRKNVEYNRNKDD